MRKRAKGLLNLVKWGAVAAVVFMCADRGWKGFRPYFSHVTATQPASTFEDKGSMEYRLSDGNGVVFEIYDVDGVKSQRVFIDDLEIFGFDTERRYRYLTIRLNHAYIREMGRGKYNFRIEATDRLDAKATALFKLVVKE